MGLGLNFVGRGGRSRALSTEVTVVCRLGRLQEMCQSVAQLMVATWLQGSRKGLIKVERDRVVAMAVEAAKVS